MELKQEVLNVSLARFFAERGLLAHPELQLRQRRSIPDVYLQIGGLPIVVEAEVETTPNAHRKAWEKVQKRFQERLCYAGIAVVYPEGWRHLDLPALEEAFRKRSLYFAIALSETSEADWRRGSAEELVESIRQLPGQILSEEDVEEAVKKLKEGVQILSNSFLPMQGVEGRLAEVLGMDSEAVDPHKTKQATAVRDIAALILMNALLFHEELSRWHKDIPSLAKYENVSFLQPILQTEWRRILREINYHAVFDLAVKVLQELSMDSAIDRALRQAVEKAQELSGKRAILRHDVAGRIYHLLLGDIAKPLGTYYTSVAAATLLLRLALAPERWEVNWADPQAVGVFKIADFACGTGTLLMAAVQALLDNHLSTGQAKGETRKALLKALLEESVWGFDVLQSALHITATTLALPMPEVMLKGMRLYAMPLGLQGGQPRLGSLEFLRSSQAQAQRALFPYAPEGEAVTASTSPKIPVEPPRLQLICMNPPFTRTCGDNLLFGHLHKPIRHSLKISLKQLLQEKAKGEASLQAGLGAVFIALAHRYLAEGGRLAFVVPKSLLSGVSWKASRDFLQRNYHLEYVIASHDPNQWNFSENTDLSEVMFVAKLNTSKDAPKAEKNVIFLNLWQNVKSPVDAIILADIIRNGKVTLHKVEETEICVGEIWMSNNKMGEIITMPQKELKRSNWLLPIAFAQHRLNLIAYKLVSRHQFFEHSLPLIELGRLATLGPDRRQVRNHFVPVTSGDASGIPGLWGHDSEKVISLEFEPNVYLSPGLDSKVASLMRKKCSNLMVAERLWLNTCRVTAVRLTKSALSNVWWPVTVRKSEAERESYEKALALWLNSTLGLLLLLTVRQETRGAWVAYKKENLSLALVLDLEKIPIDSVVKLSNCFDKVSRKSLLPLPEVAKDPIRAQIDDRIAAVLGIPSEKLKEVRELLQQEPILTLVPLRRERQIGAGTKRWK